MPSLNPAQPGWVLTASHLLSLGLCWVFRFQCFLTILHNWAGFLHVLTNCLQRLVLAAVGDWGFRAPGVPVGYLGGLVDKAFPGAHWWASWWSLTQLGEAVSLCCPLGALATVLSPQSYSKLQYSEWDEKELGLFGGIPTQLGNLGNHSLSRSLVGRNHSPRFLWALSCGTFGGGKGNCSYPL